MIKNGTVAIVTGGGKGVGAGIARVFCQAGAKVCINYNSSEALARKTLADILDNGGEAFLYQADISDRRQVEAMVAETVRQYGGVDVLVNNAGLQPNRFIKEYEADMLSRIWNINIGGYWLATQICLPYLKKSSCPRIINIGSVHSKRPTVFDPGYAMTKAANHMFTREAALELAEFNITVNTIILGACQIEGKTVKTKIRIKRYPEEINMNARRRSQWTYPEDVGHLAAYLASPEAQSLSGAGIRLDRSAMLK